MATTRYLLLLQWYGLQNGSKKRDYLLTPILHCLSLLINSSTLLSAFDVCDVYETMDQKKAWTVR